MSRLSCDGYRHNKTLLLYCDSPELVKAVCGVGRGTTGCFIQKFTPHETPPVMVRAWTLTMPQKPDGAPPLALLALVVTIAAGPRRPPRPGAVGRRGSIAPGGYRAGSEPGRARARLRLFFHVTPHPPPLPQLRAPSPAAEERVRPPWFVKLCRSNEISLAFLKGCMEISPELLGQILHRLHSSAWNENRRPGIRIQSQVKENKSC